MARATLDPAGPFGRFPVKPHQLLDRVTRTEDTIVLCHLGVPRLDRGRVVALDRWARAAPVAPDARATSCSGRA